MPRTRRHVTKVRIRRHLTPSLTPDGWWAQRFHSSKPDRILCATVTPAVVASPQLPACPISTLYRLIGDLRSNPSEVHDKNRTSHTTGGSAQWTLKSSSGGPE